MVMKYTIMLCVSVRAILVMEALVEATERISACCSKDPSSASNGSLVCAPCESRVYPFEIGTKVKPCPKGQFLSQGRCRVCRKCGPGTGMKRRCKRDSNTVCKMCRKGTFSDKKSAYLRCRPCKRCGPHEKKTKECRPSRDTACGKCKRGYFRSSYLGQCWKCSYCFPEYPNVTQTVPDCRIEENKAEYRCQPLDRPPYVHQTDGVTKLEEFVTKKTNLQSELPLSLWVAFGAFGSSVTLILCILLIIIRIKTRTRSLRKHAAMNKTTNDKNIKPLRKTEIRWIENQNTSVVKTCPSQCSSKSLESGYIENDLDFNLGPKVNTSFCNGIL